jgi:hypothetical protein
VNRRVGVLKCSMARALRAALARNHVHRSSPTSHSLARAQLALAPTSILAAHSQAQHISHLYHCRLHHHRSAPPSTPSPAPDIRYPPCSLCRDRASPLSPAAPHAPVSLRQPSCASCAKTPAPTSPSYRFARIPSTSSVVRIS